MSVTVAKSKEIDFILKAHSLLEILEMQLTCFSNLIRMAGLAKVHIHCKTHVLTAFYACTLCKCSKLIYSSRLKKDWKQSENVFFTLVECPHIAVRTEAEACHGPGRGLLTQHSISSMHFVNKRLGFPACWMCTQSSLNLTHFAENNIGIHLVCKGPPLYSTVHSLFHSLVALT